MDETPLIHWPCYEPAGQSITLTEEELVQHVLVIGSTGSGKTTLLTHALQQLIPRGVGLLIQDAKCDGTVEQVRAVARACGREEDVVVLGPEGTHALDLFGPLRMLDALSGSPSASSRARITWAGTTFTGRPARRR